MSVYLVIHAVVGLFALGSLVYLVEYVYDRLPPTSGPALDERPAVESAGTQLAGPCNASRTVAGERR